MFNDKGFTECLEIAKTIYSQAKMANTNENTKIYLEGEFAPASGTFGSKIHIEEVDYDKAEFENNFEAYVDVKAKDCRTLTVLQGYRTNMFLDRSAHFGVLHQWQPASRSMDLKGVSDVGTCLSQTVDHWYKDWITQYKKPQFMTSYLFAVQPQNKLSSLEVSFTYFARSLPLKDIRTYMDLETSKSE